MHKSQFHKNDPFCAQGSHMVTHSGFCRDVCFTWLESYYNFDASLWTDALVRWMKHLIECGLMSCWQSREFEESILLLLRWSLTSSCARPSDSDPERVWDHGAEAGGRGHPAALQPALRRLPRRPVHARRDDGAARGAQEGLRWDVPDVRRRRRRGQHVGGEGKTCFRVPWYIFWW